MDAGSLFLCFAALTIVAAIVGAIANFTIFSDKPTTHGSARWESALKAFRRGLFRCKGIRVGDWSGRLGLFYEGSHALTFGATGSGKGVAAILPNLLTSRYIFLIDPGGENTAVAAKHWRSQGYDFGCLNIFGAYEDAPWALPAHGFNPLDLLDPESKAFAADALVFAEMLTPRSGPESSSSAYFKDAAQTAKRAMILQIKTTEPAARQNLATLYAYVNSDAAAWEALLRAMKANAACGGLIAQEAIKLERIESQAPEEFSAIMSTIQQDLSFLADPVVREKLSRSDFDFKVLKGAGENQRGGVVSVVLPLAYMESHAAIPRLAMACAVLTLQRMPLPKSKVVFLIDEAATLGRISRFPNWLATLRKHRVAIWSVWQNVGQVVNLYDKNWQTIIGNCGLVQVLSVGDLETASYIERYIGRSTVETVTTNWRGERSVSHMARPLVIADELLRLPSNRQIVFVENLHPMILKKTPYWKRPALAGCYERNPYVEGRMRRANILDYIAALWGAFYYGLLWWAAPHPAAACIITAALAGSFYALTGGG
jgi:type IV secretion system protein VirD4